LPFGHLQQAHGLGRFKENQQCRDERAHRKGQQAAAQYAHRLAQTPVDGCLHTQDRTCGITKPNNIITFMLLTPRNQNKCRHNQRQ
jgi:hypothetical protein